MLSGTWNQSQSPVTIVRRLFGLVEKAVLMSFVTNRKPATKVELTDIAEKAWHRQAKKIVDSLCQQVSS